MENSNKRIGFFTKLGCHLIGWNPDILKECGEASHRTLKRYVSAIIILAVIWGTIGYCFADRYIGVDSIGAKLLISLVFIVIIVCIERFIILTVGKLGIMGVMRFVLALLMAVLGSTIFDQIIFKNDVDVKMKEIRTEQINKEIPKRMAYLDADILKTSILIDSLGRENIRLYAELSKKPTIAVTDVNTTSHQVGVDSLGNAVMQKTTSVSKRNVENPLSAQTKANEKALEMYQERLEQFQNEKMNIAQTVRSEYEAAQTGFLEELKALFNILLNDYVALGFYFFLFLFMMSLELLVVSSKGGDAKCDYDLIVEHQLKLKSETLRRTGETLLNVNK